MGEAVECAASTTPASSMVFDMEVRLVLLLPAPLVPADVALWYRLIAYMPPQLGGEAPLDHHCHDNTRLTSLMERVRHLCASSSIVEAKVCCKG